MISNLMKYGSMTSFVAILSAFLSVKLYRWDFLFQQLLSWIMGSIMIGVGFMGYLDRVDKKRKKVK